MVKRAPKPDYLGILKTLTEHEVEFIIVGGVCAVLHGAPIATFDLDVVHSRDPENVRHLLTALESLDACARGQGARKIAPNESAEGARPGSRDADPPEGGSRQGQGQGRAADSAPHPGREEQILR